jgi:hypothetical protein
MVTREKTTCQRRGMAPNHPFKNTKCTDEDGNPVYDVEEPNGWEPLSTSVI